MRRNGAQKGRSPHLHLRAYLPVWPGYNKTVASLFRLLLRPKPQGNGQSQGITTVGWLSPIRSDSPVTALTSPGTPAGAFFLHAVYHLICRVLGRRSAFEKN